MKRKILILTLFCFGFITSKAQYKEEMIKTIQLIQSAEDLVAYQNIVNRFEMISNVNTKEWLPFYYSAYINAKMSYFPMEDDKKDALLDKAEQELEKAEKNNPDNDECLVLKAYIYQARFSISYMSRLSLNDKILDILRNVIKEYPENPRAYLILGTNTYKMPGFLGGGINNAYELFKTGKEKFEIFTPKTELHPSWGYELNEIWYNRCVEKLKE